MENIAISLSNVSKYYKLYHNPKDRLKEALSLSNKTYHQKYYATKHLNLKIKTGEIIGIVGQNGSGKSTLLKLITGVLKPDEGEVKIRGSISALLELGSGFNPEFTGMQNIFFYGTILGFSKQEMEEKLDDIITFADIGEFINQPLKTYSSGMKSRLGFAVAVHIDPEILILDEVLSVGDALFKRKSYAKMQEFFESGKTIIYVSHAAGEINRLCTRAILLHNGTIILDGEPKMVTKYYEKFLFAQGENRNKVLTEIRKISTSTIHSSTHQKDLKTLETHKEQKIEIPDSSTSQTSLKSCNFTEGYSTQKPFWIPDLISKNYMEYDNSKLSIEDIYICTEEGERVNALITNQKYYFHYTLYFKSAFENVNFGMQILTEKGILVSGSRPPNPIDVKAGDKVKISWEFECLLHEGLYYMNIGVNHPVDSELIYINRIVDAFVFKVLPIENCCNGLVYLKQKAPSIEYIS
jgi:lipopolysaccharide transport system ATP-binding protein